MDLFRENLQAAWTTYSMIFEEGLKVASGHYKEFCTVVGGESQQAIEFPFLETFAFMREWIGPRQIKNLSLNNA